MTKNEAYRQLKTMPLSNLRHLVRKEYEVNRLADDLMDLVNERTLRRYLADMFYRDYSASELTELIEVKQFEV